MPHPQTKLHHHGRDIEVDEALAPFLELLWAHDIDTMMSCQDNPVDSGRVWINFSSPEDAAKFLRLAVPHPTEMPFAPDSLYNRVYTYWFPEEWPRSDMQEYRQSQIKFGLWDWTCCLTNINFVMGDENQEEHFVENYPWPDFDISVRFPFKDIEELTKAIIK